MFLIVLTQLVPDSVLLLFYSSMKVRRKNVFYLIEHLLILILTIYYTNAYDVLRFFPLVHFRISALELEITGGKNADRHRQPAVDFAKHFANLDFAKCNCGWNFLEVKLSIETKKSISN